MKKNSEDLSPVPVVTRAYLIDQIFDSWEEYQRFYAEACRITNTERKKRNVLKKIIRKYFEVEFKGSIKSPRYYYPENSESIVLQIPSSSLEARTRGVKRMRLLDEHQHVVGVTEMYIRDQIAMRLKIMNVDVPEVKKKK